MMLENKLQEIRGVGDAITKKLMRLRILSIEDLLEHYPRRYEDRSQARSIAEMQEGEYAVLKVVVARSEIRYKGGRAIVQVWVEDDSGQAVLNWFNQPYRAQNYSAGKRLLVYGKASCYGGKLQMDNPEVEPWSEKASLNVDRIVPVYSLTEGLSSRMLRKLMMQALAHPVAGRETLPEELRRRYQLIERASALREIHFPTEWGLMKRAKRRLVFEELFVFHCILSFLRLRRQQKARSVKHAPNGKMVAALISKFSFELTDDQKKAFDQISGDMERDIPMHRLLQGDVGSGKTAVALLALVKTVENGCQGMMMVPTEILAEQHFQSCSALLSSIGIRSEILTGRIKGGKRNDLLQKMKSGAVDIVFGTHALLQPDVTLSNVGLVVVDEQHRFGVQQRSELHLKGKTPHLLVMSATPIPRSMAMTIFGDLDLSDIRQLPPGRKPIVTVIRTGQKAREKVYLYLIKEVLKGKQGYVVCPLIEESETTDAQAAISIFSELSQTVLKGISCGLLHGRLKSEEKENVMNRFLSGAVSVLISTTVIEVGINVPNATMMIIEDADRFGLAQLHQLRGRVGRGEDRSYCVLLQQNVKAGIPERLKVLEKNSDGFAVAEQDLLLRGPGQFLGYRQHGLPELKIANIADDATVLSEVQEAVTLWLQDEHLVEALKPYYETKVERFFEVAFSG